MANQEHLQQLDQGIMQWNAWRERYPKIHPDLSDANLRDTHLYNADLHGARLYNADLSGADLRGADLHDTDLMGVLLREAELREADLSGADLSGADLSGADLRGTLLYNADLSGALLYDANLREAKLQGANLQRARVSDALFARIDLSTTKGLADIIHEGPSIIEPSTLHLPQDGSALLFLRGAGVPDEWIDNYRAHMMQPIQYHSCFISYTHQDNNLAHRLHADLQDNGVRCWFAPHDMHIGDKIRPRIDEAIHLQDKLLLILSEHSVASDWVEHEVETALARERRDRRTILFPIRLDDTILECEHTGWPALVQNERHIGDFTGWENHNSYQVAFDRLLHDLKRTDE